MRCLGALIGENIDDLERCGVPVVRQVTRHGVTFRLAGPAFSIEVIVEPERWLGVRLNVLDVDGRRIQEYSIDTDAYSLWHPKHHAFAFAVEAEIVAMLQALRVGTILIGNDRRGRPALVVPHGHEYVVCTKESFFGFGYERARRFSSLQQILAVASLDRLAPLAFPAGN